MTDTRAVRLERYEPDGTPQPASAAMTKEEADRLVARTHGQLQAFRAADGNWYVYETKIPDPS
jgi:hypothetical protein